MVALAFIMIHVGYEFELDQTNLRQYGWDYVVAMTAAAGHVLALTVLANLGIMVPALCYRREAHWKERLALAIGMWPRGEVEAGVLIVSLGYGIGGPMITAAMLSLALNLVLTGAFILLVQWLVAGKGTPTSADLVPGVHPVQHKPFTSV
jgi:Kef-type K+ transport system membrane component KefB